MRLGESHSLAQGNKCTQNRTKEMLKMMEKLPAQITDSTAGYHQLQCGGQDTLLGQRKPMGSQDVLVFRHGKFGCQEVMPAQVSVNNRKQRIKAWRKVRAVVAHLTIICIKVVLKKRAERRDKKSMIKCKLLIQWLGKDTGLVMEPEDEQSKAEGKASRKLMGRAENHSIWQ